MLPFSHFAKFMTCSVFNIVWNTIFMEVWKRRNAELCLRWGIFDTYMSDRPRAQFRGSPGTNPVTGKAEIVYPK